MQRIPSSESKMAAQCKDLFLDENMDFFEDPQRTIPFSGVLYQDASDKTTYYLDEDLTLVARLVKAGNKGSNQEAQNIKNEGFTKDQTLYIIEMMREHVSSEGDGPPKSLKDLRAHLNMGKKNKRQLWQDMAAKLACHFERTFCPDKVFRKWNTLVEGYKKAKDSNNSTGRGPTRFMFYREMDELLGGHHDVVFPVVGTSRGLVVRRPELLGQCRLPEETPSCIPSSPASKNTSSTTSTELPESPSPTSATPRTRKRSRDCDVLAYLRDAETAHNRRHQDTIALLRAAQQSHENLMARLLEKL